MIIYKRFLLLNEVDNSGCSAIVKFENFQSTTLGNVKVLGKKDKFELVINFNGKIVCMEIQDDQSFDLNKEYDLSTFIQAIIIKNKEVICSGSTNGSNQPYSTLLKEVICNKEEKEDDIIIEASNDDEIDNEVVEDVKIVENVKKEKPCFYEKVKPQLDEMFSLHPKDEELNSLIDNSSWIRVFVSSETYYVVGLIYDNDDVKYICYGVFDEKGENPPENNEDYAKWMKIDENHGYWMMYQSAISGETLTIDLL